MNSFFTTVFIQNTIAEYEVFQLSSKFKAVLVDVNSSEPLPVQISLWKEKGKWTSYQPISQHVLYQFGNCIDNHVLDEMINDLKMKAA